MPLPRSAGETAFAVQRAHTTRHGSSAGRESANATTLPSPGIADGGDVLENTRLPVSKWFAALYLMTTDKGEISAERLRKMIGVNWRSAQRMLDKLRAAMADRGQGYVLEELVELHDYLVGDPDTEGKAGRGSQSKRPVLVAVGVTPNGERPTATFMKARAVDHVDHATVAPFASVVHPDSTVHADGFKGLSVPPSSHQLETRTTSATKADE